MDDTNNEDEDFEQEGLSLEELSQSYASVMRLPERPSPSGVAQSPENTPPIGSLPDDDADNIEDSQTVTPSSIIEAILFVGRQDSSPIAAKDIAALMRGVSESEVCTLVDALNACYEDTGRAIRIVQLPAGYKLDLAPQVEHVRERFYGQSRDVRLNQAAIDCLALVAYQPGLTRERLEEQRGQPSGGVLNQLVRRELIEMRRELVGKKLQPHYYPTERLMQLTGLASIEDLPQAEDWQ
ncbi:MAG: SMC-Scp complex subunit ScpB [Planctomycetales bacterium]|nr:SMC-Scp complex subunit ScpB [Planctomycetales bacterium]